MVFSLLCPPRKNQVITGKPRHLIVPPPPPSTPAESSIRSSNKDDDVVDPSPVAATPSVVPLSKPPLPPRTQTFTYTDNRPPLRARLLSESSGHRRLPAFSGPLEVIALERSVSECSSIGFDNDNDEDISFTFSEDSGSRASSPQSVCDTPDWMFEWAEGNNKPSTGGISTTTDVASTTNLISSSQVSVVSLDSVEQLVGGDIDTPTQQQTLYLVKNHEWDTPDTILSGWLSVNDKRMYFQLEKNQIVLKTKIINKEIPLAGAKVQSKLLSDSEGHCVVLQTTEESLQLLPVTLKPIDQVFAPPEQHEAAMHLLFAIDAVVRMQPK